VRPVAVFADESTAEVVVPILILVPNADLGADRTDLFGCARLAAPGRWVGESEGVGPIGSESVVHSEGQRARHARHFRRKSSVCSARSILSTGGSPPHPRRTRSRRRVGHVPRRRRRRRDFAVPFMFATTHVEDHQRRSKMGLSVRLAANSGGAVWGLGRHGAVRRLSRAHRFRLSPRRRLPDRARPNRKQSPRSLRRVQRRDRSASRAGSGRGIVRRSVVCTDRDGRSPPRIFFSADSLRSGHATVGQ